MYTSLPGESPGKGRTFLNVNERLYCPWKRGRTITIIDCCTSISFLVYVYMYVQNIERLVSLL